jgi:hypothetical protein
MAVYGHTNRTSISAIAHPPRLSSGHTFCFLFWHSRHEMRFLIRVFRPSGPFGILLDGIASALHNRKLAFTHYGDRDRLLGF